MRWGLFWVGLVWGGRRDRTKNLNLPKWGGLGVAGGIGYPYGGWIGMGRAGKRWGGVEAGRGFGVWGNKISRWGRGDNKGRHYFFNEYHMLKNLRVLRAGGRGWVVWADVGVGWAVVVGEV
jgi:hypothetical protein